MNKIIKAAKLRATKAKLAVLAATVAVSTPAFANSAAQQAVVTVLDGQVATLEGYAYTLLSTILVAVIGLMLFKRFVKMGAKG